MNIKFSLVPITLLMMVFISCQKEKFYTSSSAKLKFSSDTVMFDTVFSTIGSATKRLMVHNPYNKTIKISKIYLGSGNNSYFRLNIDGKPGNETTDIEIAPNDSMYIFVEVTVNPTGSNSPVIIDDSVIFITNGDMQRVILSACGQDVHLYNGKTIKTMEWKADKPYLIYNYILVDSNETLTIDEGAVIYMHHSASFAAFGSLIVNGSIDKHVIFRGDRLEELYKDLPGQWGAILLINGSTNNKMNYAEIRNATAGIQIGQFDKNINATLELSNCLIQNMSFAGIYAFGAHINGYNNIIDNCESIAIGAFRGGSYRFVNCTISNSGDTYSNTNRKYPSVLLSNNFIVKDSTGKYLIYYGNLDNGYFGNCIISGSKTNEIGFSNDPKGGTFNYLFDHCLLNVNPSVDTTLLSGINLSDTMRFRSLIKNVDPKFNNPGKFDFQLDSISPALDMGSYQIAQPYPLDYLGTNRLTNDEKPDLGAYERKK